MNELGKYIDIMLKSKFPQNSLYASDKFLRFLNDMGLKITLEDLEYYDEKGILKPVARLTRAETGNQFQKYETILGDIFTLKNYYYKNGSLEIVKDEFYEWKTYKDEHEKRVFLYYHPYQFLPLKNLLGGSSFKLDGKFFERVDDIPKAFADMKDIILNNLSSSKQSYEKFWIPRIGLLILLDEPYSLPSKGSFKLDTNQNSDGHLSEWIEWRQKTFKPEQILNACNLTIDDVMKFYEIVAREGRSYDPLSSWFTLQRIIQRSMLLNLKKDALYAQMCYDLSWMLSNFIFDLSGQTMLEPDDLMDGNHHGEWKKKVYGDSFDYETKKTQKEILDKYLAYRPIKAGIIFEGETEEVVIDSILKAIRVDKVRNGFFTYNANGQSNIVSNLNALYDLANLENIVLFVILDNDEMAKKMKGILEKNIKLGNVTFWTGDFEYDNFGIDSVLAEVNVQLKERLMKEINKKDVLSKLNSANVLMSAIDTVCKEHNGIKIADVISKKTLAQKLMAPRLNEIEKERASSQGWKPKLRIEFTLNEIFRRIPRTTFSYPQY